MKSTIFKAVLGVLGFSLSASVQAVNFDVTVTNLTHGMYLGPVLVAAHTQRAGVYSPGSAASANLRTLAESGNVSAVDSEFIGSGAETRTLTGTVNGKVGPGQSVSTTGFVPSASNDRLSILGKLMPTNDGFAAVTSIIIPTDPGRYVYNLIAYDAGTEANDELIVASGNTVGVQGISADADIATGTGGTGASGADTNTTVHVHRGVLGDDSPTGGVSDLDVSRHRWLNPVARVIIDVN
jgi:Spondin_N